VYIKQAASSFSLLIMIPFKIQSLEVLQGYWAFIQYTNKTP